MQQTLAPKKTGWTDQETNLLWETAQAAQQSGAALKSVFEQIAQRTGRRPNSIRNYYYAQVRERLGSHKQTARFVPFEPDEVMSLLDQVLRDKANGKSVRACLHRLSQGDHSLMLRYQNKYRSIIKTRPDLVQQAVDALNSEGIQVQTPMVKVRAHRSLPDALSSLSSKAHQHGDPELVRAIETLSEYLLGEKSQAPKDNLSVKLDLYRMALDEQRRAQQLLTETAQELIVPLKDHINSAADNHPESIAQLRHQLIALEQLL